MKLEISNIQLSDIVFNHAALKLQLPTGNYNYSTIWRVDKDTQQISCTIDIIEKSKADAKALEYCKHEPWTQEVKEIFAKAWQALDECDEALTGSFAHIVWADYNMENIDIDWCLNEFERKRDEYVQPRGDYSFQELDIVKWSLEELLKIPEDKRLLDDQ